MENISNKYFEKKINLLNKLCRENGDTSNDLPIDYTRDELTKKRKFLAKIYHPDCNPNDDEAQRVMQEINSAYDVLKEVLDGKIKVINSSAKKVSRPDQNTKKQSNNKQNSNSQTLEEYKKDMKDSINNLLDQLDDLDTLINFFEKFTPHNMAKNKVDGIVYLSESLFSIKNFKTVLESLMKSYINFIDYSKTKDQVSKDYKTLNDYIKEEVDNFISIVTSELKEKYQYFNLIEYDTKGLKKCSNFSDFATKIEKYVNYVNIFDIVQILLTANKNKKKEFSHNIPLDSRKPKASPYETEENIEQYRKNMINRFNSEVEKLYSPESTEYKEFINLWSKIRFSTDSDNFFKNYVEAMHSIIEAKFYHHVYSYNDELKKLYEELYLDLSKALSQFKNRDIDISYLDMFYKIDFTDYQRDSEILLEIKSFSYIDDLKFFVDTTIEDTTCIYYAKSFGDKIIAEKIDLVPFGEEPVEEVYSGDDFIKKFVSLNRFFTDGETVNKSIGHHHGYSKFDSIAKMEYKGLILCLIGDTTGRYLRFTKRANLDLTDDVYTLYNLKNCIDDNNFYKMLFEHLNRVASTKNLDMAIEDKKNSLSSRKGRN